MEPRHFDRLTRALSEASSRRGLVRLLSAVPVAGGLLAVLDPEEAEAKGRRKRRKKRHKHGKGRHKGKRKRSCKPEARTKTCTGRCGPVKNNCRKTVACEPCACTADADCTSVLAPDCVGNQCTCGGGAACAGDPERCCAGVCVDLDNSHDHCGACGVACGPSQICVDGACVACDVTCTGTPAECGTALQVAINAPGPAATVYVCPGVYHGGFSISNSVTVIGAGQGDDVAANTILHGGAAVRVLYAQDAFQTIHMQRLRFTAGLVTTDPLGGAGIVNAARLLVLTDCTISDNHTNVSSTQRVHGGIFTGGFSKLEMTGCTISDNSVTNGDANGEALGAGISNSSTGLIMTNCVIRDNTATGVRNSGAGLHHANLFAQLTNCRITGNTLTMPNSAAGGGITEVSRFGGSVTLTDSFVWNNTAPDCVGNVIGPGCGTAPPA